MVKHFLIAAPLLAFAFQPAYAGKTPVGGTGGLPVFVPELPTFVPDLPVPPPPPGDVGSEINTPTEAAQQLELANRFCKSLPEKAYVIDCLADQMDKISRAMPSNEEMGAAKQELARASRELNALARSSASRSLPPARARLPGRAATSRPLVPTVTSPEVTARAEAILDQTQTVLLRSAPSKRDSAGYQRIAAAVGSTKVLLRSL